MSDRINPLEQAKDPAQEICNKLWKWYRTYRTAPKNDETWETILSEGKEIISHYDDIDYRFATDMYFCFLNRLEAIEEWQEQRKRGI